jgi:hypothetical protein
MQYGSAFHIVEGVFHPNMVLRNANEPNVLTRQLPKARDSIRAARQSSSISLRSTTWHTRGVSRSTILRVAIHCVEVNAV